MARVRSCVISLLLSAAMVVPALTLGCSGNHDRVYDADHGDYHTWNNSETVYYQQWETENHYPQRFQGRMETQATRTIKIRTRIEPLRVG